MLSRLVFILGALVDWYTTKRALVDRKGFKDRNPIVRRIFDEFGPKRGEWILLAWKLLVGVVLHVIGASDSVFYTLGVLQVFAGFVNKYTISKQRKRKN